MSLKPVIICKKYTIAYGANTIDEFREALSDPEFAVSLTPPANTDSGTVNLTTKAIMADWFRAVFKGTFYTYTYDTTIGWSYEKNVGTEYQKPEAGIPKSDLSQEVLDKINAGDELPEAGSGDASKLVGVNAAGEYALVDAKYAYTSLDELVVTVTQSMNTEPAVIRLANNSEYSFKIVDDAHQGGVVLTNVTTNNERPNLIQWYASTGECEYLIEYDQDSDTNTIICLRKPEEQGGANDAGEDPHSGDVRRGAVVYVDNYPVSFYRPGGVHKLSSEYVEVEDTTFKVAYTMTSATTATCDKSYQEVLGAIESGVVIDAALLTSADNTIYCKLTSPKSLNGVIEFSRADSTIDSINVFKLSHIEGSRECPEEITISTIEIAGLPEVSASDNGKILGVASGSWGVMDAPASGPAYVIFIPYDLYYNGTAGTVIPYKDQACTQAYSDLEKCSIYLDYMAGKRIVIKTSVVNWCQYIVPIKYAFNLNQAYFKEFNIYFTDLKGADRPITLYRWES